MFLRIAVFGCSSFVVSLLLGCTDHSAGSSRPDSRSNGDMDPKLKEVLSFPRRIEVEHSPNPVKAQVGGKSGANYTWLYKTTVRTTSGPVRITEFGAFVWFEETWRFSTYTGEAFSPTDFSEWYSCDDATLLPGTSYSDPTNWSGSDVLVPGRGRWYFIGVDQEGNRVMGEAEIEQLPTIQ